MSDTFHFRSAFNGFHREDVVRYIQYLNTNHAAEINQLNTQLEQLSAQATASDEAAELRDQLAAAQEINEQLQARIAELELQLQEAQTAAPKFDDAHELEVYRRAERTEREAKERAEQICRQANGALADATAKVDATFSQIGQLTNRVNVQLQQLQEAVTDSHQVLADAAASLYSISPCGTN